LFMRRAKLNTITFLDHPEPTVGLDWWLGVEIVGTTWGFQ
jgi:hypothetical protein